MRIKQISRRLCLAVLVAGLTGCAGYRLGSMLPPGISTVYVPTFVNETDEPQIEFETTSAVVSQLVRDGSLRVVSSEEAADAILLVTLVDYRLSPIGFEKNRATASDEFRVFLIADTRLVNARTGEVILHEPAVSGDATFELQSDLTSGKRTVLPLAAQDLGRDIVQLIVEFW